MNKKRTDLALEAHEMLMEAAQEISGVTVSNEQKENIKITRIKIETQEAADTMSKPIGNYITIELPNIMNTLSEDHEKMSKCICEELVKLVSLKDKTSILVIGLGNRFITPDALGPDVVSKTMVTRHLLEYIPDKIDDGVRPVSAVSPGVLGITGIETVEIVKGIVDKVKPDIIIAVDALAARNVDRVLSTVQIADTGISPGSGVGNNREGLNKEFLGVPVIAIGVPTVIDAVTITSDIIDNVKKNMKSPLGVIGSISSMDEDERFKTISESTGDNLKTFIVTPKEIDALIDKSSTIVANGINLALHKDLTLKDIEAYVS